jgi:ABC-type transport system substrate-binding protein
LYLAFPPEFTSDKLKNPNYKFSYNPEKAKEYLSKSSCYPKILERELDLRMRADDENKAKGLALQQYLVDIGLKVKINPMEKSSLYKENDEKKEYDVGLEVGTALDLSHYNICHCQLS